MTSVEVAAPPACVCEPPGRAGSYGDDVAEVAERIGRPLVPEQRLAVDVLTAHDRRGRFLSVEAGIEVGRQNGKTGAVLLPILLWSALTDPDEYLWTAHMADTTTKAFTELVGVDEDDESSLMRRFPWLERRIRSVSRTHGNEGVQFSNGATLGFRCRSAGRGRGLSGTGLVLDETLELASEQAAALLPLLATRSLHGNARVYYASSAAKRSSTYLRSVRRRAVAGDPSLTYVGWWARGSWAEPGCAEDGCTHEVGVEGCALDDEDRWAQGNPLLGRLTSRDFLVGMRRQLEPVPFGREFLGWEESGDDAVDLRAWGSSADSGSESRPGMGYGLAVAPKGASAAIVAAGVRADGLWHVEIKEHAAGTAWLRSWLEEHADRVWSIRYLAGTNPTTAVLPDLAGCGVQLVKTSQADFAGGCDALDQAVAGGRLKHRPDPRLTTALGAVMRRDVGDGSWVMTWRGSKGDASPAMAMALAVRALMDDAGGDAADEEALVIVG